MKKQTIVIAGGIGNIGKAAATAVIKRGARVVLLGSHPDKLKVRIECFRRTNA